MTTASVPLCNMKPRLTLRGFTIAILFGMAYLVPVALLTARSVQHDGALERIAAASDPPVPSSSPPPRSHAHWKVQLAPAAEWAEFTVESGGERCPERTEAARTL